MSDEETRTKRAIEYKNKRRNKIARDMLDRTGPYKPQVRDARKGIYRRPKTKIRVNNIDEYDE